MPAGRVGDGKDDVRARSADQGRGRPFAFERRVTSPIIAEGNSALPWTSATRWESQRPRVGDREAGIEEIGLLLFLIGQLGMPSAERACSR